MATDLEVSCNIQADREAFLMDAKPILIGSALTVFPLFVTMPALIVAKIRYEKGEEMLASGRPLPLAVKRNREPWAVA